MLVTSSSSSEEHAELEASRSSSGRGPLSWLCMPSWSDVLPSCTADPTSSKTKELPCHDFQSAFESGRLLPYLVHTCTQPPLNSNANVNAFEWNGHLPLDPTPHEAFVYPCLRNRRKHRIPHDLNISFPSESESWVCAIFCFLFYHVLSILWLARCMIHIPVMVVVVFLAMILIKLTGFDFYCLLF
jgi:hypothetical protein